MLVLHVVFEAASDPPSTRGQVEYRRAFGAGACDNATTTTSTTSSTTTTTTTTKAIHSNSNNENENDNAANTSRHLGSRACVHVRVLPSSQQPTFQNNTHNISMILQPRMQ